MAAIQRSPGRGGIIVAVLAVAGLGIGFAMATLLDHQIPPAARIALAAIATVAGLVAAVVQWRSLDEAAREAHKWAWYWGSSLGMLLYLALAGLLFTAAVPAAIPGFDGRTDPLAFAVTGALGLMGFQVVAYLAAWIWWWLSKR